MKPVRALQRRRQRASLALAVAAALLGVAGALPVTAGALGPESAGIYSEELERANSADPVAAGHALRAAGVGIVRQPFSWARIETRPGELDYAVYDDVMATAAIARVEILPVLMDPPDWRSTVPATGRLRAMYPPRDPAELASLAALLVARYGPGGSFWAAHPRLTPMPIRSWQVWNEPNVVAFWATGPDPAAYVRLLDAVGAAIHAADPGAEVVAAGLPVTDGGMPLTQFLREMYAAGARGSFDTLAIHPYAATPAGVLAVLSGVRAQLDRLGETELPIWATEFGWATGGPPVTITTSEAAQAARLGDAIVRMQEARAALVLRGFVAFRWRDVAPNPGQADIWALHTGLLRADGAAKPALAAFTTAVVRWLREPAPGRARTLDELELERGAAGRDVAVAGVSRRALRIRRSVRGTRLIVSVDVPPGGGSRRVRIGYQALRGRRVIFAAARLVATRRRVARVVFRLSPTVRRAGRLRISASQGSTRARRSLVLRGPPRARPRR